jgi:hypothetical protein
VDFVRASLLALLVSLAACPSPGPEAPTSATPSKATPLDAGARASTSDAGVDEERPFAGSTAEATSLISGVVEKKHAEIATCVRGHRARKKLEHQRVSVSFGIDQEGKLLGVTTKGKEDAELKSCLIDALKGAPFPRSHSGVITVTKTYEELVL